MPPSRTTTAHSSSAAVAARLACLADELHLRMLRVLEREELTVGEVAAVFQLPQSTVSRRLKHLAEAGWLQRRAAGPATLYSLSLDDLAPACRELWLASRAQLGGQDGALVEDDRRLEAVLAQRQEDSLAFFGRVAGEWDKIRAELFGKDFTAPALLALLDPSWTVADVGCGTGNVASLLAPHVARVIAVDSSEVMLSAVRKRLDGVGNIEIRQGSLEALPLEDASVDAVVCALVLHHLEAPERGLRQCARCLKPGGVLLVLDMVEHDHAEYRRTMGHKRLGFSDEETTALLLGAGLAEPRIAHLPSAPGAQGPSLFVATARRPRTVDRPDPAPRIDR